MKSKPFSPTAHSISGTKKARSSVLTWVKRIAAGFLIVLLALSAVGALYQAIGAQADKRKFPPPGQLYDVGGYRLHLQCTGPQNNGSPTVILETLSGGTSPYWAWVQQEIAKETRVCSYDRAGRGWSEASPHPLTLQQTVDDLHTLLEKAGVAKPYVLAGHSIGGIYVRKYAADYPDEVAGLVLVDSAHLDQFIRYPGLMAENQSYQKISALFPVLAQLGIFRAYFAAGNELDFGDLPKQQHDEVVAFWSSPEYFISQHAEGEAAAAIYRDARSLGQLGDIPLAVVSAGKNQPAGWSDLQSELSMLSTNSIHSTIPDATHVSLAFNQKHALETAAAILNVMAAAREHVN